MVNEILDLLGLPYRETLFRKPPKTSYVVFSDAFESRGADDRNFIREHDIMIELYSYTPDPENEKKIEKIMDDLGIAFEKQTRYWIETEQLYQVIYEFNYSEKGGN